MFTSDRECFQENVGTVTQRLSEISRESKQEVPYVMHKNGDLQYCAPEVLLGAYVSHIKHSDVLPHFFELLSETQ
jgi:hypothetical protein